MSQTAVEELNRKISDIKKEMKMLRSFLIGVLAKDQEGEYKPEFVKKILKFSKEKAEFTFKDERTFLKQIQKNS